jgi:hypothetical protein
MMIAQSIILIVLLSVTTVEAFRAPENPSAPVKLPKIQGPSDTSSVATLPLPATTTTTSNTITTRDIVLHGITPDTLAEIGKSIAAQRFAKPRHADSRKKWGVDNTECCEYWYDSRIHTLGNIGFLGAVHAALAPLSTKIIDNVAYDGQNVRGFVAKQLRDQVKSSEAKVLDVSVNQPSHFVSSIVY